MPKNKQRNSFYFLAMEIVEESRKKGIRLPQQEAFSRAGVIWKTMSPEEKMKYEEMARDWKLNKDGLERKYTSDGQLISVALWKDGEPARRQEKMARDVKNYVSELQFPDGLKKEKFYILSFNIVVKTADGEYIPNEIGIAEYSIEGGLHQTYHKFIDPGPIPLGYGAEAKEHSEMFHQIPISNFSEADKNYGGIYFDLRRFINPTTKGEVVPVFCKEEQLAQTEGCLQWLYQKAGTLVSGQRGQKIPVNVWDLTLLLMELCAAADKAVASKALAEDKLRCSGFDYISNNRCDYHEEKDNCHCALGVSRSLCYMLSDVLCAAYAVECTEKHLPSRTGGVQFHMFEPNLSNVKPAVNRVVVTPKPMIQRETTTIVPVKSKFVEEDEVVITPSATLGSLPANRQPVVKKSTSYTQGYVGAAAGNFGTQVPELKDEEEFPSLGGDVNPTQTRASSWGKQPLAAPLPGTRQPHSNPANMGRGFSTLLVQQQMEAMRFPKGIGRGANILPQDK